MPGLSLILMYCVITADEDKIRSKAECISADGFVGFVMDLCWICVVAADGDKIRSKAESISAGGLGMEGGGKVDDGRFPEE